MGKLFNPVKGDVARKLLGAPGPAIGKTRYAALLNVTGQAGLKYVRVEPIQKYLADNPGFSELDVYPRKSRPRTRTSPPALVGRRNDESLLRHA